MKKTTSKNFISFLGLLLFVYLAIGSVDEDDNTNSNNTNNSNLEDTYTPDESIYDKPIYNDNTNDYHQSDDYLLNNNGGSLHRSTLLEWKNATYSNKLSTCTDFVLVALGGGAVAAQKYTSTDINIKAKKLVSCVEYIANNSQISNKMAISEIATMCLVELGYY